MVVVAIGEMNEAELLLSTGTGENEQSQNSPALEKGSVLLLHMDLAKHSVCGSHALFLPMIAA